MYKVRLKVIGGKHDGRTIAVKKNKFLIGREQDCHLRPKTDLISRHHCVFNIDDYGVRLRDLGSRNGTYVNGKQLTEDKKLEHGDKVSFAGLDFWMIIKEVEPEEVQEPANSLSPDEFSPGADTAQETTEMPMLQVPEGAAPGQFQPQQPGMPMSAEGQPAAPWPPGYGMQQPPAGYPQQMPPWGYPPQQMPPWGYPPQQMPGYPPQQYPQYPPQGYPEQPQPVQEESDVEEDDTSDLDIRLPDPEETGAVEEEKKSDGAPPPAREGKTPAEMAAEMLKKGRRRG